MTTAPEPRADAPVHTGPDAGVAPALRTPEKAAAGVDYDVCGVMAPKDYDALLLASFGGPEGQDDVIPFLRNVTRGRGIPDERLEEVALEYAADINRQSPQALRMLKFAFNLPDDGMAGQQVFAGEATRMAYMTDEAVEGRDAFLQKRDPDWSAFPYHF